MQINFIFQSSSLKIRASLFLKMCEMLLSLWHSHYLCKVSGYGLCFKLPDEIYFTQCANISITFSPEIQIFFPNILLCFRNVSSWSVECTKCMSELSNSPVRFAFQLFFLEREKSFLSYTYFYIQSIILKPFLTLISYQFNVLSLNINPSYNFMDFLMLFNLQSAMF